MSTISELIIAIETQDLSKWREILKTLSNEDKEQIVQNNKNQLFHLAASKGNLQIFDEVINAILANTEEYDINDELYDVFVSRNGEGFRNALENQHNEIVYEFLNGSLEEYLYFHCLEVVLEKPEYIAYIYNHDFKDCFPDLIYIACYRSLADVQAILNVIPIEEVLSLIANKIKFSQNEMRNVPISVLVWQDLFVNATLGDHADVIYFLWQKVPRDIQKDVARYVFSECFIRAAKNRSLKALLGIAALLSQEEMVYCLQYEDYNTFVYSADRGNIEMLKWVWAHLSEAEKTLALSASRFAAYRLAKQNNHQEVVAFLKSIAPENFFSST